MPFEPIVALGQAAPIAPYSHATRARNTVYVSGVIAMATDGSILHPGNITGQTRVVLESITATLEAAGGGLSNVVINHLYISDFAGYKEFNAVYAEYFPGNKPARYCIRCDLVKADAPIEIASVAHL